MKKAINSLSNVIRDLSQKMNDDENDVQYFIIILKLI